MNTSTEPKYNLELEVFIGDVHVIMTVVGLGYTLTKLGYKTELEGIAGHVLKYLKTS